MENTNPTGISELEKIKWMISRVDLFHKGIIETFTSDTEEFEAQSDKGISKLKEARNYLLSVVGLGLTILFGTTPIFNLDVSTFSIILIILGISGLGIFVFFTKLIGIVEQMYNDIISVFNENIGRFHTSNAFFVTVVSDLTKVTFDGINHYRLFVHLLTGAVMLNFSGLPSKIV